MTKFGWVVVALGVAACAGVLGAAASTRAEHLVYIGTYTGAQSKGIYAFTFDDASGALTPKGLVAELTNPSFLTRSADGRFVFAVSETSTYNGERSGSVASFAVDRATSKLALINVVSSKGADPCHLVLDRTGRFLAVANYTGGTYAIFPVGADGRLGEALTVKRDSGAGPNRQRQEGPHAHMVLFDADNRFLYGADLGLDRVHAYQFDEKTGAIQPLSPAHASVTPGAGPRHLAMHPNGRFLFLINELNSTITTLARNTTTGALTVGSAIPTLPADFKGDSTTAEIAVHPNGRFLYGSNRGHDSIAVYRIADSGQLSLVEIESTRGRTPRNFTLDPTGRWLIAGNQDSNTLAVFRIDEQTGALAPAGPLAPAGSPVSVLFMN